MTMTQPWAMGGIGDGGATINFLRFAKFQLKFYRIFFRDLKT
jgi:hypothetical protein